MKKRLLLAAAFVLLLETAFGIGLAPPAFAGEWSTSYGSMSLPDQPRPGALRAPYSHDNGRIVGEMLIPKCLDTCGPQVRGVWVEADSAHECSSAKDGSYYWGNVELDFNVQYTSFSGHWDYCGEGGGGGSWQGGLGTSRMPQQPSR